MTRNDVHTPSLITRMNREWQLRMAETTYAFPHGTMTCEQTLQLVSSRAPGSADIVRGLFEAAGRGDETCLRTSLQIMLPAIVNVAGQCRSRQRCSSHTFEEPLAVVTALAVERIKNAPLHRPGSVLGNLSMDLLKYALRHFANDGEVLTHDGEHPDAQARDGLQARLHDQTSQTEVATRQLLRLAAWARDHDVLTETETSVFVCYGIGSAEERTALADRLETTKDRLAMRAHRIRKRLKKAVSSYALERTDLLEPEMVA